MSRFRTAAYLLVASSLLACSSDGAGGSLRTLEPQAVSGTTSRIRVLQAADGRGIFVDEQLRPFIPRGTNFVRLQPNTSGDYWHSTFDVGRYDPGAAAVALSQMQADGYNIVRVFLNVLDLGNGQTPGVLNAQYMNNLADFIDKARQRAIRVLITTQWLPASHWALHRAQSNGIGGYNKHFLDPAAIATQEEYLADVARHLTDAGLAPAVFAYDLINEGFYEANQAPFDRQSGQFLAPNGVSYDLSTPGSRQELADASAIYYADRLSRAIKDVDPSALTTLSVFSPLAVGHGAGGGLPSSEGPDYRHPFRITKLAHARIDFFDIHLYPDSLARLNEELARLELNHRHSKKPLLLGEFGALATTPLPEAAQLLTRVTRQTCQRGFAGWLFWTWDTDDGNHPWHTLVAQGGALNGVVAPVANALPCSFSTLPAQPNRSCFHEQQYLDANPDVAHAVMHEHLLSSGYTHYILHGREEGRAGCNADAATGLEAAPPLTAPNRTSTDQPPEKAPERRAEPLPARRTVHRYYHAASGDHFLTWEQDAFDGYRHEGPAFFVFTSGHSDLRALYRCRTKRSMHFVSNAAGCEGQISEGSSGWIARAPRPGATRALYRCYLATTGDHLSTVNRKECEAGGYRVESIQGYVP